MRLSISILDEPFDVDFSVDQRTGEPFGIYLIGSDGKFRDVPAWLGALLFDHVTNSEELTDDRVR